MSENALLKMKNTNLMKALNREGADYVPTMLAASCAMVAWEGKKVTDIIDDADAYVEAMTNVGGWKYVYRNPVYSSYRICYRTASEQIWA